MARDQGPRTEEEREGFQRAMEEQVAELREALAEDLGGGPEDYEAEKVLNDRAGTSVADGGDEAER